MTRFGMNKLQKMCILYTKKKIIIKTKFVTAYKIELAGKYIVLQGRQNIFDFRHQRYIKINHIVFGFSKNHSNNRKNSEI